MAYTKERVPGTYGNQVWLVMKNGKIVEVASSSADADTIIKRLERDD